MSTQYHYDPIEILDTTDAIGVGSGGSLTVGGGIGVGGSIFAGGNISIEGTSASFADNIILVNANPQDSSDTGIIFQRHSVDSTNGSIYTGLLYSENSDEFLFSYLSSDPGRGNISIDSLAPLKTSTLTLASTTNASGIGNGGALTVFGGGAISNDLYIGNTLSSLALTTGTAWITNAIITNLTVANSNIINNSTTSNSTTVLETFFQESLAGSTTTSTSFQPKINTSTGSLSASTYLLQLTYEMSTSSAFSEYEVRFSINGTPEFTSSFSHFNTSDNPAFQTFFYKNLNAGSQTLVLEYRKKSGSGSVRISNAKLLLVKIAVLENFYTESLASSTTTSVSFQTKINAITSSLSAGRYAILYTYQTSTNADLVSYQTRFSIDGTPEYTSSFSNQKSTDSPVFTNLIVKTFNTGTKTLTLDYRRTATSGSITIRNAKILLYRLE